MEKSALHKEFKHFNIKFIYQIQTENFEFSSIPKRPRLMEILDLYLLQSGLLPTVSDRVRSSAGNSNTWLALWTTRQSNVQCFFKKKNKEKKKHFHNDLRFIFIFIFIQKMSPAQISHLPNRSAKIWVTTRPPMLNFFIYLFSLQKHWSLLLLRVLLDGLKWVTQIKSIEWYRRSLWPHMDKWWPTSFSLQMINQFDKQSHGCFHDRQLWTQVHFEGFHDPHWYWRQFYTSYTTALRFHNPTSELCFWRFRWDYVFVDFYEGDILSCESLGECYDGCFGQTGGR